MIVRMAKIRVLGPRQDLSRTMETLQDAGVVHLSRPRPQPPLEAVSPGRRDERHRWHLENALEDIAAVLEALGSAPGRTAPSSEPPDVSDFARWRRLAGRLRREVETLRQQRRGLQEERALIVKYRHYFDAFRPLFRSDTRWPNARAYHLVLSTGEETLVDELRWALRDSIGEAFEILTHRLPTGELALLLLVTANVADRVDAVLTEARVEPIPVPRSYGGLTLSEALPRMVERLSRIPEEIATIDARLGRLRDAHVQELEKARGAIRDRLAYLEALPFVLASTRAFVIEGWIPKAELPELERTLREAVGPAVSVDVVSSEGWQSEEAPVVLSNPRLFRPFEALIRLLPLPRYGNIDPTPFVAVFFPMFFGVILGDVGYGATLAILGLVLHRRSRPGSMLRDVAEIAGPCAAFAIVFGFLYGELFGDLGHHWFGLEPVLFGREEAVVPFLVLAVGIGVVHIVLGLGLGAVTSLRSHPRKAAGRGLAALMVILIVVALLAAFEVLPELFLTPVTIALLVAFPLLVILEGFLAPIEFLSTLGNILSYARIMAIGTASVMLAVVANRMAGAVGSAVVGVVFALLFHLVNFALGLFSPTIHALRLHYVEFFGKFYSPGGTRYRPFSHWHTPPDVGSSTPDESLDDHRRQEEDAWTSIGPH